MGDDDPVTFVKPPDRKAVPRWAETLPDLNVLGCMPLLDAGLTIIAAVGAITVVVVATSTWFMRGRRVTVGYSRYEGPPPTVGYLRRENGKYCGGRT